jgi:hypothetical protein
MEFAERETRRHQNAPPHHRADPGQPAFDLQNRGGIRRKRREALFRSGGLRPSFHPASLAPTVPLVPGTPQKVMLSYNWRALVEADIGRWKRVIGDALRSQADARQATEAAVAVNVLNRMLELGRPNYVRIA